MCDYHNREFVSQGAIIYVSFYFQLVLCLFNNFKALYRKAQTNNIQLMVTKSITKIIYNPPKKPS